MLITSFIGLMALSPAAPQVEPYVLVDERGERVVHWADNGKPIANLEARLSNNAIVHVPSDVKGNVGFAPLPPDAVAYRVRPGRPFTSVARSPGVDASMVRIGFITDTQENVEIARRAVGTLARHPLDALVHGGDFVQRAFIDAAWDDVMDAMRPITKSTPLIPVLGNHDILLDDGGQVDRFLDIDVAHAWRQQRLGPVNLVVLDSTAASDADDVRSAAQREFLIEALKTDAPWTVVTMHHPLHSEGIAYSTWAPDLAGDEEVLRERFSDVIEEGNVDLVVTGHTHLFERSLKDDVEYLVGGPAGGMMGLKGGLNPYSNRSERIRTVSVIVATEDMLEVRSYRLDGSLTDTLVKYKRPGPRVAAAATWRHSRCER